MIRAAVAALAFSAVGSAGAAEPIGLHASLETLARDGKFSGAVVIRDARGVRFARGYGRADPFAGRRFTAATPVDSASLAKPVTAATVLALVRDGKVTLDQPVRTYLPEYPNSETTVRHLLAHSAGLPDIAVAEITGKTNADLLAEVSKPGLKLLFRPGTGFSYCNLCYSTLALLIERVTGRHYLDAVRAKAAFPGAVGLRPAKLADWQGRAIGYRTGKDGKPERADSYENELFYGSTNFSVSAEQLALWGSRSPTSIARRRASAATIWAITRASIICSTGMRSAGFRWRWSPTTACPQRSTSGCSARWSPSPRAAPAERPKRLQRRCRRSRWSQAPTCCPAANGSPSRPPIRS
jgi:CubicO group peptidase (beta-lactamase class C family)